MGRKRREGFDEPHMLTSRVERYNYYKFEDLFKRRDGKSLQELMNLFVIQYISGNIRLIDNKFHVSYTETLGDDHGK